MLPLIGRPTNTAMQLMCIEGGSCEVRASAFDYVLTIDEPLVSSRQRVAEWPVCLRLFGLVPKGDVEISGMSGMCQDARWRKRGKERGGFPGNGYCTQRTTWMRNCGS